MNVLTTPIRLRSKPVHAGNHVVWSSNQPVPISFFLAGMPADGAEFGLFRVPPGDGIYCSGYQISPQVPGGSEQLPWAIEFCTGDGTPVPGGRLEISGISIGAELKFIPPVALPPLSLWKLVMRLPPVTREQQFHLAESLQAILWLQFAPGPVPSEFYSTVAKPQGINYDTVGLTNVIG